MMEVKGYFHGNWECWGRGNRYGHGQGNDGVVEGMNKGSGLGTGKLVGNNNIYNNKNSMQGRNGGAENGRGLE